MPVITPHQYHQERIERLQHLIDTNSDRVLRDPIIAQTIHGGESFAYPRPNIGSHRGKLTITGYILSKHNKINGFIVKCDCGSDEFIFGGKFFQSKTCPLCVYNPPPKPTPIETRLNERFNTLETKFDNKFADMLTYMNRRFDGIELILSKLNNPRQ
jgi:hypothetical protein